MSRKISQIVDFGVARLLTAVSAVMLAMLVAVPAHAALVIHTSQFAGDPPPPDKLAGSGNLQDIFEVAADAWETIFAAYPGDWEVTIEYGWGNQTAPLAWGKEYLITQSGYPKKRITESRVYFNNSPPAPGFYADPTPLDNTEYASYHESIVEGTGTLNNGRVYTDATGDAAGRIDLLTIAMHEIGHSLGLDYDYAGFDSLACNNLNFCIIEITVPGPYKGLDVILGAGPHLQSMDPPAGLLLISDPEVGQRNLITDLDALLITELAQQRETRANFGVNKVFSDGNDASVEVTISCNTGLPLVQSQSISAQQSVEFVVESFDDGELDCSITELPLAGYTPSYNAGFDLNPEACIFEDVAYGLTRVCNITNTLDPVEVTVNKLWFIEGQGGDDLDPGYTLELNCNSEIVGGAKQNDNSWRKALYSGDANGTADHAYVASVKPGWENGTSCWVSEVVFDSTVETGSDCGTGPGDADLWLEPGAGDSCTVTNSVFYEGIPALNGLGKTMLVLLMLAAGLAGFRRMV